jgi:hypothetical protein
VGVSVGVGRGGERIRRCAGAGGGTLDARRAGRERPREGGGDAWGALAWSIGLCCSIHPVNMRQVSPLCNGQPPARPEPRQPKPQPACPRPLSVHSSTASTVQGADGPFRIFQGWLDARTRELPLHRCTAALLPLVPTTGSQASQVARQPGAHDNVQPARAYYGSGLQDKRVISRRTGQPTLIQSHGCHTPEFQMWHFATWHRSLPFQPLTMTILAIQLHSCTVAQLRVVSALILLVIVHLHSTTTNTHSSRCRSSRVCSCTYNEPILPTSANAPRLDNSEYMRYATDNNNTC